MRGSVCVLALVAAGCHLDRFTAHLTAPLLSNGTRSFDAEGDLEIARAAAPAQLKAADGLLETVPEDRRVLELVARGYLLYTFGFVEDELESTPGGEHEQQQTLVARATALYDRALGFALRLLVTYDRGFRDAFAHDQATLAREARRLGRDAVPGLVLGGMALSSSANLNRADLSRAVELPKAIAMLERAHELDPSYYWAASPMVLGIIYGSEPASLGGDPARAKRYFDEALALTHGRYLLVQVMMARAYAVAVHDRALFERTLRDVLATPADVEPRARLANEMARRRAARYLARAADFF
jgi:tetratricopeptide (TPR) repeat protein